MPDLSRTPVYNLKAVLRETGLTADILHAWERRYKLPVPQRSQGGQRLYSQYDVSILIWLKARQEEGFSISRAVERWKELSGMGRDPLAEYSKPGIQYPTSEITAPEIQVDLLQQRWLEACLDFDESKSEQLLNQAFSLYPVEKVCFDFLQWGLREIGNQWYEGQASVQQEHFISALASRRLGSLIAGTPAPTRSLNILTACSPGEWHTFPALLLTLLLRRQGYNVFYLGPDVPSERLPETIMAIHPNLVVLTAERLSSSANLCKIAQKLKGIGVQTGYGGWVFNRTPTLRARIPAHFLGETIELALRNINLLIDHPLQASEIAPIDGSLVTAAQKYRLQRGIIETEVVFNAKTQGIESENVQMANAYLGEELLAALDLGDQGSLTADIEWIRSKAVPKDIPQDLFTAYLSMYAKAVKNIMKDEAGPISDWLMISK